MWKDPRLCITAPAWRHLLSAPIVTVLVVREPSAAAASLERRDGISPQLGLALWEAYTVGAMHSALDTVSVVVDYDAVVEDPRLGVAAIARVSAALGMDRGAPTGDETRSVSRELRHYEGDDAGMVQATPAQRDLYARLRSLAGDAAPPVDDIPTISSASVDAIIAKRARTRQRLAARHERRAAARRWRRLRAVEGTKRLKPSSKTGRDSTR